MDRNSEVSKFSPRSPKSLFPLQHPWSLKSEYRLNTQHQVIDNHATNNAEDNDNDKQVLEVSQYFLGKEKHHLQFISFDTQRNQGRGVPPNANKTLLKSRDKRYKVTRDNR